MTTLTLIAKPRSRTLYAKKGWQIDIQKQAGIKRLIVSHSSGLTDFPLYGSNNVVYWAREDEIPYWVREEVKEIYQDIF